MDIIVTGFAGYEGSLTIYKKDICREKLLRKYPKSFFDVFENNQDPEGSDSLDRLFEEYRENLRAADGSEGGVLAALWNVLKAGHFGGTYSQKDIPVLQQTVELCEMFDLNPYRLRADNCRVWVTGDASEIADAADTAGVPFRVIGFTRKGAAIKRTDTEGDSSLRRPEEDELVKITDIISGKE